MSQSKKVVSFILILLVVVISMGMLLLLQAGGKITETNDIKDYGKYLGNYDMEFPAEFISSFFPRQIEDYFSNVTYHYKARKGDAYAFEAWLEFTIEDPEMFREFVQEAIDHQAPETFDYNGAYLDYTICYYFDLCTDEKHQHSSEAGYPIDEALVGKILYCEETRQIIFWALGVHDGFGAKTTDLNHFLDYFNVDPLDFAKNATKWR